jgi:hypothetical protein
MHSTCLDKRGLLGSTVDGPEAQPALLSCSSERSFEERGSASLASISRSLHEAMNPLCPIVLPQGAKETSVVSAPILLFGLHPGRLTDLWFAIVLRAQVRPP